MKTFRRHRRNGPRYSEGDVWTVKETPWLSADERVVIVSVEQPMKYIPSVSVYKRPDHASRI